MVARRMLMGPALAMAACAPEPAPVVVAPVVTPPHSETVSTETTQALPAPSAKVHYGRAPNAATEATASPPARTDAECRAEHDCLESGRCRAQGPNCVALDDADCRASEDCKREGYCTLVTARAQCWMASDGDCRGSDACTGSGLCFLAKRGDLVTCTAKRQEDCAASTRCLSAGHCDLGKDGFCVLSAAGCARSQQCREKGACGMAMGVYGRTCAPTTLRHCLASEACKDDGRCRLGEGPRCNPGNLMCSELDADDHQCVK